MFVFKLSEFTIRCNCNDINDGRLLGVDADSRLLKISTIQESSRESESTECEESKSGSRESIFKILESESGVDLKMFEFEE